MVPTPSSSLRLRCEPRGDRPIAVEYLGYAVITLHPIKGLEFVEEAVTALGYSTELATYLFRECWVEGTGRKVDLCRAFGWEVEAHKFKVATAAGLVAIWHNARITVDRRPEEVSAAGHLNSECQQVLNE